MKKEALMVNVGDWVITNSGKLVKITSDDMPDLKYEDINRMATEEEIPMFDFKLEPCENLGKENFWDPFMKKCPDAVGKFCKWIDQYKESVSWKTLFQEHVKFHDVPFEMQYGILIDFLSDKIGHCSFPVAIADWQDRNDVIEFIILAFVEMELENRNNGITH